MGIVRCPFRRAGAKSASGGKCEVVRKRSIADSLQCRNRQATMKAMMMLSQPPTTNTTRPQPRNTAKGFGGSFRFGYILGFLSWSNCYVVRFSCVPQLAYMSIDSLTSAVDMLSSFQGSVRQFNEDLGRFLVEVNKDSMAIVCAVVMHRFGLSCAEC